MGLTNDLSLIGEVGGIVIGGTIFLIVLIFYGNNELSDDKDGNSPVASVLGRGRSRSRRHKKKRNTKKKR